MSDLGPLFALGRSLATQAINTGGTTVRVEMRTQSTDPETLATTVTAVVQGSHPALVVPVGGATAQLLAGVELRTSDWKVVLTPDVTPPVTGAWIVVTASKDPHLPGREAKVLGHVLSSAGAVLTVYARPPVTG